jgi:hypothetical protein
VAGCGLEDRGSVLAGTGILFATTFGLAQGPNQPSNRLVSSIFFLGLRWLEV